MRPAVPRGATGRRWAVPASLVLIAIQSAAVGVWAGFAPHSFIADFPGLGLRWIAAGTAYDEHFVRDVGFLHLPLGVIAAGLLWQELSARTPGVKAFGVAWSTFAIPHLGFHLTHTDGIHGTALVTSLTGLTLSAVAGVVLMMNARRQQPGAHRALHRPVRS